jgi:hypothetical protein
MESKQLKGFFYSNIFMNCNKRNFKRISIIYWKVNVLFVQSLSELELELELVYPIRKHDLI